MIVKQEIDIDISALDLVAKEIADSVGLCNIFLFYGDLGVGKTTFIKMLCNRLGIDPNIVSSPTFNLVHLYDAPSHLTIWHYDLYRLTNKSETLNIGLSDAMASGITLVEWPEIIEEDMTGVPYYKITLEMGSETGLRNVRIDKC